MSDDIVTRLRAGKADRPDHVVVWVENMHAFIATDMFRTFPEWREVFKREFDALLDAASEAADTIEALRAQLAETDSQSPNGEATSSVGKG